MDSDRSVRLGCPFRQVPSAPDRRGSLAKAGDHVCQKWIRYGNEKEVAQLIELFVRPYRSEAGRAGALRHTVWHVVTTKNGYFIQGAVQPLPSDYKCPDEKGYYLEDDLSKDGQPTGWFTLRKMDRSNFVRFP